MVTRISLLLSVVNSPFSMLLYGKEASNRKQEIDRQHHTIPKQRPKDKHYGNVDKMKGNSGVPLFPPPCGYIKNPDDPRFWVVDPEAAEIVRRVYQMAPVNCGQLLPEEFFCQSGFDVRDTLLRPKARFTVCAAADHVDMGMMALVVEGGVPAEPVKRNLHSVRKLGSVTGKQVFPLPGVVVTQTGGVLPAQRNDGEPYVAGMGGHCIRHPGERERIIPPGEQPVGAEALRPGTPGDVVHVVLPFSEGARAVLNGSCDELRGILTGRGVEIVFVLKQLPGRKESPGGAVRPSSAVSQ